MLADGRIILLTDHQKRPRLQETELVDDGLREHHVGHERLVEGVGRGVAAPVDVGEHVDPDVVGLVPRSDVVGGLLLWPSKSASAPPAGISECSHRGARMPGKKGERSTTRGWLT